MHSRQLSPSLASPPASPLATLPASTQRWLDVEGRRFLLRPLRADDSALLGQLWNDHLSRSARFSRFHASLGAFSPERLKRLCQIDPAQGGAFLITQLVPGGEVALAEGRWAWLQHSSAAHLPTGRAWAELSVSVADRWQGCGLGLRLVQALTRAAQQQGAQGLRAQVLPGNQAMQALLARGGYRRCSAGYAPDADADVDTFEHTGRLPAAASAPQVLRHTSGLLQQASAAAARLRHRLASTLRRPEQGFGLGLPFTFGLSHALAAADPETHH